jgi:hypothetical protein
VDESAKAVASVEVIRRVGSRSCDSRIGDAEAKADEIIDERSERNAEVPDLVEAALRRRQLLRETRSEAGEARSVTDTRRRADGDIPVRRSRAWSEG